VIRRAQVCAAVATIGLLALPSVSAADALDIPAAVPAQFRALVRARLHMPPPRQGFEARFELKAQHGYEVAVVGEGNIVAVEVLAPTPHGKENALERFFGPRQAVTAYVARGTVTPHRITASFGKLGEVDVRFRPSGKVAESDSRKRCRGVDHFTSQLGVFVGGIRFSGEKDYVAFRSHRAKGRIRTPLRLHCASSRFRAPARLLARPVGQQPSFIPTFLEATDRHGVASTELAMFRAGKTTLFLAITEEGLGSMARLRYALTTAPSKKVFTVNDALTSASIDPPRPFHGRGTYRAAADGTTSWSGSLSVSLPGAPRLPLTGSEFKATLESGF
jgi:hypothetical protein